jgi:hypothetical protein
METQVTVRFRRTLKLAPGVRINVTKTGVGVRVGPRGLGLSAHSSGRVTAGAGIPGSGLYYQQTGWWPTSGTAPAEATGDRPVWAAPDAPSDTPRLDQRGARRRRRRREFWRRWYHGGRRWTDTEHAVAEAHHELKQAAMADHLRGGGPNLERLWELACHRFEENVASFVPAQTDKVLAELDQFPERRQRLIDYLIIRRGAHGGDTHAAYLAWLDDAESGRAPLRVVALAHEPELEELLPYVDASGLFRDMPFASEWIDRLFRSEAGQERAERVLLGGIAARVCEHVLGDQLEQRASWASGELRQALRAVQDGDASAACRTIARLGSFPTDELWTDEDADVDLPLLDGVTLTVPAGPDAVVYVLELAAEAGAELRTDARRRLETAAGDPVLELLRVRRRWLDGDHEHLAALDPPEPDDDVTALTGILIADAYQQVGRHDDAIKLADRIADVAGDGPVAAEAHLHRAWLRRAAADPRWVDDAAVVRKLRPDHPALWALPDPDRPDTACADATATARTVTFELVRATFDVDAHEAAVRADGTVLDVLATVLTADGEVGGLEAELLGRYVTAEELTDEAATYAGDPVRLLSAAATLDRPVPGPLVARYVDAIEQLARTAALADGHVCIDERDTVEDLVTRLRAAAATGRWDDWRADDTRHAGHR